MHSLAILDYCSSTHAAISLKQIAKKIIKVFLQMLKLWYN